MELGWVGAGKRKTDIGTGMGGGDMGIWLESIAGEVCLLWWVVMFWELGMAIYFLQLYISLYRIFLVQYIGDDFFRDSNEMVCFPIAGPIYPP